MIRDIEYHIPTEYDGQKISSFLKGQRFSAKILTSLRHRDGAILLNGSEVHMNVPASTGDVLTIHISEENSSARVLPVEIPLDIIYEDPDLLVINKPAGMPSHPSMNNHENTLGNACLAYMAEKGQSLVYRCVNRLDKNTSGLTIIAKHAVAAGILNDEIAKRQIHREYTAIVEGEDLPDEGRINAPIARIPGSTIKRTVDFNNGKRAVTNYRKLLSGSGLSLIKLNLETGRTHQIRVHMAYIGHPLIGDYMYNPAYESIGKDPDCIPDKDYLMTRQALHAGKLSFMHPITGESLSFESDLPEDMVRIISSMTAF